VGVRVGVGVGFGVGVGVGIGVGVGVGGTALGTLTTTWTYETVVALPTVAVRLYTVVAAGDTCIEPFDCTAPTPGLMSILAAPTTAQVIVTILPGDV